MLRVGNADVTKTTRLVDRVSDQKALDELQRLLSENGASPEVSPENPGDSTTADVTLVVGQNYQPARSAASPSASGDPASAGRDPLEPEPMQRGGEPRDPQGNQAPQDPLEPEPARQGAAR